MRLTVRPLGVDDADDLALLHVEVWEQAYADLMPAAVFTERRSSVGERADRWRRIAEASPATTMVADLGGRLVGFASVGPAREPDVGVDEELWALYVHEDCWGEGVGHRLLVDGLGARPAYLWVLDGNERASRFYRRQGFEPDGASRTDEYGRELRMVRR